MGNKPRPFNRGEKGDGPHWRICDGVLACVPERERMEMMRAAIVLIPLTLLAACNDGQTVEKKTPAPPKWPSPSPMRA